MQVILLEKVEKLGTLGSIVSVKDGYARNYLLPRKRALRATKENLEYFEKQRAHVEKENQARKADAEKVAKKLQSLMVVLIRQASEDGRLYGSVSARDIASAISEASKEEVKHDTVVLNEKFKELGIYNIDIVLHPEVKSVIALNIARSQEEAKLAKENFGKEPAETKAKKEASSAENAKAESKAKEPANDEPKAEEEKKAE